MSEFGAYRDFVKSVSDDSSQMIQLVGASAKGTARADNRQAQESMEQAYHEFHAHDYKSVRELLDKVKALNDQQTGLWGEYGAIDWSNKNAGYRRL